MKKKYENFVKIFIIFIRKRCKLMRYNTYLLTNDS